MTITDDSHKAQPIRGSPFNQKNVQRLSYGKLRIVFIPRHRNSPKNFYAQISQGKPDIVGPCESDLLSSLLHGFFIIVEIVDKVVDGFIVSKYGEGEISNDYRVGVYFALIAFSVIGMIITIFCVAISGYRIVTLCCEGDCSKGRTDTTIKLWMTLVKVWLEGLPQTIITHFYFGDCATANYMKIWGITFSVFSLLPFIKYIFHLLSYYYFHGCQECDCDDVSNPPWALATITLIPSAVGAYCACKSIGAFDNLCTLQ